MFQRNSIVSIQNFKKSPSSLHNIDYDLEWKIRSKACLVIQKSCIILKLKQATAATAQILLQRFYYVKSLKDYDIQDIILGALFLSCKVEENQVSSKDLIKVLDFMINNSSPQSSLNYYSTKEKMEKSELIILINLGFKVSVYHPHGFLLNILNSLGLISNQTIVQACINYLNDALLTHVYVVYSPVTIACGSIFLACRENSVKLHQKWYILFDVCLKDLQDFAVVLLDAYKRSERSSSEQLLSLISGIARY